MLRKKLVLGASSGALVVLGLLATPAFAASRDEDVVVTGTAIKGTPENAAVPVQAINLDQLQKQGLPSNMDLIKSLTEIGSVQGETNRNNALPVGAGSVNLRNLGSNRTVVLFNGRRWGDQYSVTIGRFNNTAQIPTAAIGRIEVLKDGGNAIYGADAVGGVVNYFSRKNFTGLEGTASYRYIDGSEGDYTANVLWGKAWDRGNIMIVGNYEHRGELAAIERDWTQLPYLEAVSAVGFTWSASGSPGSYLPQTRRTTTGLPSTTFASISPNATGFNQYTGDRQVGATSGSAGIVRDKACGTLGGFVGWSTTPSPACYFHTVQFDNLVDRQNQYSVYAEGNFEFTSFLRWHGEAYWYRDDLPSITVNPSDALAAYPFSQDGCSATLVMVSGIPTCSAPALQGYSVPGNHPAVADFLNSYNNVGKTGNAYTAAQIAAITAGTGPGGQGALGRIFLPTGIWRPFGMGGLPINGYGPDIQHNSWDVIRFVNEISGEFPRTLGFDLSFKADMVYQRTVYEIQTRDMLVDRLQAALNGLGGPSCTGSTPGANGCMWFNPFSSAIADNPVTGQVNNSTYKSSLANDPALISWMYADKFLHRPSVLWVADYTLTGTAGPKLWGGPISFATGYQYRYQRETEVTNDLNNQGRTDFFGNVVGAANPCSTPGAFNCFNTQNTANKQGVYVFRRSVGGVSRNSTREYPSWAVFGELNMPILPGLTLDGAIRYETYHHDLTGTNDHNIVWAGSAKWQATDWLALRATAGNTFYNFGGGEINVTRTAITATNATVFFPDFSSPTAPAGATTFSSPTPALKSEHGFNFNVGAIVTKGNFRATLDYFRIKINDQLPAGTIFGNINANSILAGLVVGNERGSGAHINCASPLLDVDPLLGNQPSVKLSGYTSGDQHAYCTGLGANNTVLVGLGSGSEMRFFSLTNGPELITDGLDATVSYRFDDIVGGALTVNGDVTWTKDYDVAAFIYNGVQIAAAYSGIGSMNEGTGKNGQHVAEWRFNVGFNYNKGRHNFRWNTRGVSSLFDDSATRFGTPGNTQNANVGDANGVSVACGATGTFVTAPPFPANPGTGVAGPFQATCNTVNLNGQTLPWTFITDITYQLTLPWQTRVSFTVYNLFDQQPRYSRCGSCGFSYDAFTGDPLGRNFKLTVSKRF